MTFEGEIGEIDLVQRLVELGREHFTGAIRFESDGIIKIVYFKEGDVLSASTNDRTDSIDEILLRAGKVTREHIKQALARRKESETLGDALLGLGFITRKELTWARRVQVIGILRSILGWTTGSFTIVADYLPKREEGTLFPLPQVLLELIVTDSDRPRFDRAMEGGSAVFSRGAGFDDAFRRLGLNEEADAIVQQIDGHRTAAEVVAASGKDAFNVYKLLEALRLLGLIEKAQASPEVLPAEDFSSVGVSDASDAWGFDEAPPPAAPPVVEEAPAPTLELPAWDEEPLVATAAMPAMAPPMVVAEPPSPLQQEPEWGFDEAQIETARRAAVPLRGGDDVNHGDVREPRRKKSSIGGALLAALVIVVLAGGGWYGWQWWQEKNAPAAAAVTRPARPRPVLTPQTTTSSGSPLTVTTATTDTTASSMASPLTSAAAAPPPSTAPAGASTQKHPAVTPAASSAGLYASSTAAPTPGRTGSNTATATPTAGRYASNNTAMAPSVALPASGTVAASKKKPLTKAAEPATAAPLPLVRPRIEKAANGTTTITNTSTAGTRSATAAPSSASASGDAARARYDAMARDFGAKPGGSYTVQFELVCETPSVARALRDGGANVWFTQTSYRGKPCYRVFWGRYDTREAAAAAMNELPAGLRGAGTAVVKIPRG
jgi:hypothetical protein